MIFDIKIYFGRICREGQKETKGIKAIEIVTEKEIVKQDAGKHVEFIGDKIYLSYDRTPVLSVKVTWGNTYFENAKLLCDCWESAYGTDKYDW